MTNRNKRSAEIGQRIARRNPSAGYCRIAGCPNLARGATSDGLGVKYCRSHYERIQRHGSPIKDSYPASTLNPYRRAAIDWLMAHPANPWVVAATKGVRDLYAKSGPHVEAFRLRGMGPEERAKAAWARLRKEGVDPRLPLAAWLAIEMAVQDDPQPVLTHEFKQVQAAKLVHRLASGSHRRWATGFAVFNANDKAKLKIQNELHVYPKSRGRVLRWIGADLEKVADVLAEKTVPSIREGLKPNRNNASSVRAHSRTVSARKRTRPTKSA